MNQHNQHGRSSNGHSYQVDWEVLKRRDFLKRLVKAVLVSGVIAGGAKWLYRGSALSNQEPKRVEGGLPDFSVSGVGRRIAIVTGGDRAKTVARAIEALGGIDKFIKKGDRVVIKVNAAFATPPSIGATTHPDVLKAVIKLCYQAGAESVVVTDNPINDPPTCFQFTGIAQAAEETGARVVLPRPEYFEPVTLPGAKLILNWPVLVGPLKNATKLIGIAPVKDHHRSGASMIMKNWYGLLGGRRNMFHQDIHTIITELAMMVKPTLVILDGTFSMVTNGPTGGSLDDLKQTNTMIVSTDQVAADAVGATLLGRPLSALPFITRAAAAGVGTADYESLNPIRDSVS